MSSSIIRGLLAAVLFTSTAPAASIPTSALFARQAASTCALDANSPCKQAGLPSSFCCPAGTTCSLLAGNTTILCCPEGSTCNKITTITCDIAQQDPSKHPDAPIKTTALKQTLPKCGENCCPFGFTCSAESRCIRDTDQSAAPGSTTSPAPDSSASPTPSATESASPASTDNGTATMSIVGGVVGGVVALIAIAIAVWVLVGKKKKRESDTLKLTRSTSSFGNIISAPIGPISSPKLQNEDSAFRSDFIRKSPPQPQPPSPTYSLTKDRLSTLSGAGGGFGLGIGKARPASSHYGNINRPMSTWSRDSTITANATPAIPVIRNMRSTRGAGRPGSGASVDMPAMPETPRGQREPSSMSINVFADPGTVGRGRRVSDAGTVYTTFTGMMEQADLGPQRRGEPFVPRRDDTPASRRR